MVFVGAAAAAAAVSGHDDWHDNNRDGFRHSIVPSPARESKTDKSLRMSKLEADILKQETNTLSEMLSSGEGHWLVDSMVFKSTIIFLVVLNAILMGVEVDYPEWKSAFRIFDHIFGAAFIIEMVTKIIVLRTDYVRDRWNWLDGGLAIMGFLDTWFITIVGGENIGLAQFSILRVLRLLRLVRLARLFRAFSKLVIVLKSIVDAIETTFWVASVLLICIYVFAIFCVDFIGHAEDGLYPGNSKEMAVIDEQEVMQNFNPHLVFGSMGSAMLSLFNIGIMAEWTEIVRPVLVKQPVFVLVFIFFVIFVCFGVMNVIIGMIVDSVIQNARSLERELEQNHRREKVQVLHQLKDMIFQTDANGDQAIDVTELDKILNSPQDHRVQEVMDKVSLPYGCSADEFFALLDTDGDGYLLHEEFIQSLYRLINCGEFQQTCLIQIGVNKLLRQLGSISAELERQGSLLAAPGCEDLEHPSNLDSVSKAATPPVKEHAPIPCSVGNSSMPDVVDQSCVSAVERPELSNYLDAVCQEVIKAVHSKLREELNRNLEGILAAAPSPVSATHGAEMTGQWEVMEQDKLRKPLIATASPIKPQSRCAPHSGGAITDEAIAEISLAYPVNAPDPDASETIVEPISAKHIYKSEDESRMVDAWEDRGHPIDLNAPEHQTSTGTSRG